MGLFSDARSIASRDPAARNALEVFLLYPGFHAVILHRIAHLFYRCRLFFVARMISQAGRFFTGIEIHPGATIGRGLFIDHGMGVVIGETAEIGDNCTIYHQVTLGGTGKHTGKRHPTIGNSVLISTGAKILGPFCVGDNARIGANAVVLQEVEPDATVVGVPGRVTRLSGQKVQATASSEELDQIHMPDVVAQEICRLMHRIQKLETEILKQAAGPADEVGGRKCNEETE